MFFCRSTWGKLKDDVTAGKRGFVVVAQPCAFFFFSSRLHAGLPNVGLELTAVRSRPGLRSRVWLWNNRATQAPCTLLLSPLTVLLHGLNFISYKTHSNKVCKGIHDKGQMRDDFRHNHGDRMLIVMGVSSRRGWLPFYSSEVGGTHEPPRGVSWSTWRTCVH